MYVEGPTLNEQATEIYVRTYVTRLERRPDKLHALHEHGRCISIARNAKPHRGQEEAICQLPYVFVFSTPSRVGQDHQLHAEFEAGHVRAIVVFEVEAIKDSTAQLRKRQ